MQDRHGTNDLANGAVRYVVYDAGGNLLRYEWIRPEDEPLEAGTPLLKAKLLTDETAAKVWPAGDADRRGTCQAYHAARPPRRRRNDCPISR